MAKHPFMASVLRKTQIHHSNFKAPITGLSKISQPQFCRKKQNIISNKQTTAQQKHVQEWRSMKAKKSRTKPSGSDVDDDFLEVQPLMEEPISFNFGDDYGNHLFLELQKELSYQRNHNGLFDVGRGINVDDGIENTSDDIYKLSTEADMINSFLRDNLF